MVVASLSGVTISFAITAERALGTLTYLIGSPANRVALFFGRAAVYILEAVLLVLVGFAWIVLAFGLQLPIGSWGGMVLAILIATLAVSGLGLLLGAVAYLVLDAAFLVNLMVFALLLLSGANIPLSELPPWLAYLGQALPLTRSIEAARALAAGGEITTALPLLLGDLAIGLGYALAGFTLFSWIETQARRRGTFEGV